MKRELKRKAKRCNLSSGTLTDEENNTKSSDADIGVFILDMSIFGFC